MSKKLDFQLKLLVYQKQLEFSFFQNVAKTTKHSFFLSYSICHQAQGHLHLDKSIVPWIESLITTQCVLFCPDVGYLPFWKINKRPKGITYRAPEYNVPPFWGISQSGHFCFLIGPKNTNLVEDIEILLPVKFRWIRFNGFRGEVENVSANQRPGRPSCFSDRPEKHKLGRGHWDHASCQVSLNSIVV